MQLSLIGWVLLGCSPDIDLPTQVYDDSTEPPVLSQAGEVYNHPINTDGSGGYLSKYGVEDGEVLGDGSALGIGGVVAPDGFYLRAIGTELMVLDRDFQPWYSLALAGDAVAVIPAVDPVGNTYIGTSNGWVQAFDIDGNSLWNTNIGFGVGGRMTVDREGRVYALLVDPDYAVQGILGGVAALDGESGELLYIIDVPQVRSPVAIGDDGAVLFVSHQADPGDGTADPTRYRIGSYEPEDGSLRWEVDPRGFALEPMVAPDGSLIVSVVADVGSTRLLSLDPDTGEEDWSREDFDFLGRPSIASRGSLWLGCDVSVCQLDLDNGKTKRVLGTEGFSVAFSPAIQDGWVVANADFVNVGWDVGRGAQLETEGFPRNGGSNQMGGFPPFDGVRERIPARGMPGEDGLGQAPDCAGRCLEVPVFTGRSGSFPQVGLDGAGGATLWLYNGLGQTMSPGVADMALDAGLSSVSISAEGAVTGAEGHGLLWVTGVHQTGAGPWVSAVSAELPSSDGQLVFGSRTGVFGFSGGVVGENQHIPYTIADPTTQVVNGAGDVLWTSWGLPEIRVGSGGTSAVTYSEGVGPNQGSFAVLDAQGTLVYAHPIGQISAGPGMSDLDEEGAAYLSSESTVLWDGQDLAVSHPDFNTRGFFAKATPQGEPEWAVTYEVIGDVVARPGAIAADGLGGMWAAIRYEKTTDFGRFNELDRVVQVGGVTATLPPVTVKPSIVVHIDASGEVISILVPQATAAGAENTVGIADLEPTPDGGVLVLGAVVVVNPGNIVPLGGGPMAVGNVVLPNSGDYVAYLDVSGNTVWANSFSFSSGNSPLGSLTLDGDEVWISTTALGEISWEVPIDYANMGLAENISALLRVPWR